MGQANLLELFKSREIDNPDKAMLLRDIAKALGLNKTSVIHNARRLVQSGEIKYVIRKRARYYYLAGVTLTPADNKFKVRDTIRDELVDKCFKEGYLMLRNLRPTQAYYKSSAALLSRSGLFYTPDPPEHKHHPGRKYYLTEAGMEHYKQKQKRRARAIEWSQR